MRAKGELAEGSGRPKKRSAERTFLTLADLIEKRAKQRVQDWSRFHALSTDELDDLFERADAAERLVPEKALSFLSALADAPLQRSVSLVYPLPLRPNSAHPATLGLGVFDGPLASVRVEPCDRFVARGRRRTGWCSGSAWPALSHRPSIGGDGLACVIANFLVHRFWPLFLYMPGGEGLSWTHFARCGTWCVTVTVRNGAAYASIVTQPPLRRYAAAMSVWSRASQFALDDKFP